MYRYRIQFDTGQYVQLDAESWSDLIRKINEIFSNTYRVMAMERIKG